MFFISFNTENEYLSNQNLRLAISTAIEKESIVNNILRDGSNAADYIVPANFARDSEGVYFRDNIGNPTYNSYDLTAASEYWEAAKEELGTDSITLELLYNEDTSLASVDAYVQSQLQTNLPGLTVELRVTTYNQRLTDMGNGDYDMPCQMKLSIFVEKLRSIKARSPMYAAFSRREILVFVTYRGTSRKTATPQ